MKDKKRFGIFLKYAITFVVSGAISATVYSLHGTSGSSSLADKYRVLCDAFTIPGVILLMLGLLVWVSTTGTLDGITYVFSWLWARIFPAGAARKREKYYEYVDRKKKNRSKGYAFLFICGAIFMAAALIFMGLFYHEFK